MYTTYFEEEVWYMFRLKQITIIRPQLKEEKHGGLCKFTSVFISLHVTNEIVRIM